MPSEHKVCFYGAHSPEPLMVFARFNDFSCFEGNSLYAFGIVHSVLSTDAARRPSLLETTSPTAIVPMVEKPSGVCIS